MKFNTQPLPFPAAHPFPVHRNMKYILGRKSNTENIKLNSKLFPFFARTEKLLIQIFWFWIYMKARNEIYLWLEKHLHAQTNTHREHFFWNWCFLAHFAHRTFLSRGCNGSVNISESFGFRSQFEPLYIIFYPIWTLIHNILSYLNPYT